MDNVHESALDETEVEEIVNQTKSKRFKKERHVGKQSFFGNSLPRTEIVFFSQFLIILIVISTSIYNLSVNSEDSSLWISLLSSCLGYILPNPTLQRQINQ